MPTQEEIKSLGEKCTLTMTDDELLWLKCSGGGTTAMCFVLNTHLHMLSHIQECFNRTRRLLEVDYAYAVMAYHIWSEILQAPILIHCTLLDPVSFNKVVR